MLESMLKWVKAAQMTEEEGFAERSVNVGGMVVTLPPQVFECLAPETWKVIGVIILLVSLVLFQVVAFFVFFFVRDAVANAVKRLKGSQQGEGDGAEPHAVKTMVVLGSGGHTAEMLRVVKFLDLNKYKPRVYVVSQTDGMSAERALRFEREQRTSMEGENRPGSKMKEGKALPKVVNIPRSREVGQSYVTSVFTTSYSLFASVATVFREMPMLLLCNGPGTCLPVCLSLKLLRPWSSKIVFVESICRTRSLSLTGKIIYHLRVADTIFVQWPELCHAYPRTTYSGRVF
ncbi:Alg14-like oligosaccharide biosynthesis protein [Chloropicon primus]|uniref:UDP-N-acetylglucosamine transferase subunit ALG14 n=1 Tax=Chloropicon primus TaxID=1764295 RepID=A0A5B8MYA7_9CHLO|nr:Alg14-like oligosaccharide biosynthesis protein [Chloropicon primus]UPR04724.1 Alg14-like oligosaccharide biosynthesis protein [Chloropicon primus]|eukprot:QDZ25527.1 Alg14-like oligosaccharide biosynthesis protein [Chloropicon primus]